MEKVQATMIEKQKATLMNISSFTDPRGKLGVIEQSNLPFEIKRIYYLFDVPIGAVRGEHGHKNLLQFMICMSGSCTIRFNDGNEQSEFNLDNPSVGLYVPPGLWRSIHFKQPNSVLCVLASEPYDTADYIYSYEEFLVWTKSKDTSKP